jgi:hypothetical protein
MIIRTARIQMTNTPKMAAFMTSRFMGLPVVPFREQYTTLKTNVNRIQGIRIWLMMIRKNAAGANTILQLIPAGFAQIVIIKPEIMGQLVDQRNADLFPQFSRLLKHLL